MILYFYDSNTDTLRKFGHLTAGEHLGERFDKITHEWNCQCCPKSACRWDEIVTEKQAQVIIERQKQIEKTKH